MVSLRSFGLFMALLPVCSMSGVAMARPVEKVTIEAVGQTWNKGDEHLCDVFRPTVVQVKRYFSRAYPVDHYWFPKKFFSPCYAAGTVRFSDGSSGKWKLGSGGVAEIVWDINGRTIVYYEKNGWHDPMHGMYDDGGDE